MGRPGDRLTASGVTIDAETECGGVQNLRFCSPSAGGDLWCFEAPLDGSPLAMWWHFRVRGARGRRIWFHLVNVPQVLGGGALDNSVPVVRDGNGPWRRVAVETCRKLGPRGPFEFAADFRSDSGQVAWCYPYGPRDLASFLRGLPARKRKLLRLKRIGTSREGRALHMVSIGSSTARARKPGLWLTARNHAGEVAGTHALEGLLLALTGEDPAARRLRSDCVIHVVPFVDIDSVVAGRYGKDHLPRDPNRDWSADPIRPEPRAIIAAIEDSRRREMPSILLDLHCPGAGEVRSYPVMPNPSAVTDAEWSRHRALALAVERACPPSFPVRLRDWSVRTVNWGTWISEGVTNRWAREAGMTSLTLELTYGYTARGNLATAEDYRAFGAGLRHALASFLRRGTCRSQAPAIPRAPGWETVRLPERGSISARSGGGILLRGRGDNSRLMVKKLEPLPCSSGRVASFSLGTRLSAASPVRVKLVVLPRSADNHWTGEAIERYLTLARGRHQRRVSVRTGRIARSFRVGLELVDLSGELEVFALQR